MKKLEGQAAQTANAWDKAGKKIGISGRTLQAGLAGITAGSAAAAYESMVRGVLNIADGFAEAAKSAGDLATATGGTVEQVSAMQAALVDAGVSADKSAAMLTKFTTAAGSTKGTATLKALNVELVRGQSGAVDYAATMTAAVDAIGAVGDAAQRNAAFVNLFGKQGAAAFQDLLASGATLAEAQKAIASNRIFTAEDYQNALRYDNAIDSLNASLETTGNTAGRTFLPDITAAAQGLGVLADAASKIPGGGKGLLGWFAGWTAPFALLGEVFGDDAEAAAKLKDSATDTTTAVQALSAVIASGATSGEDFAAAVAAAGDELAAQDANARLAAQALDVYRASTDQAYESTLKLLDLNRSERSAQRSAEGAADAAGDAKANMDKALADAKAAKTVVENIAAIRGRERKKVQEEGIVAGSTDVREIEGIKGRKAQKKTRVIEAAGVITPAEARQIREATRQYEDSLDDIAAAWEALADAKIKALEADGKVLTEAEKLDEVRKALQEGLQTPGLSPKAKANIKADLAEVEKSIKALGGVPIEIDGIKFKGGTDEKAAKELMDRIQVAIRNRDFGMAERLSDELETFKVAGPSDLKLALGLDPASVAASQAALANLGIDPKTGKPYTAKTVAKVDKTQAQKDLDALTKDREMTVTVNYVPGTGAGGSPTSPYPAAPGPRLNFGGAQAVSFNPTVVNNYPLPERASDSVASSLRTAKYLVGLS